MAGRLLAIGECMVELMQAEGGLMRKSFAGDTFNTAYYARQFLPADWSVDYLSAVGKDMISDEMLAFMEGHGIGTDHVARIDLPGEIKSLNVSNAAALGLYVASRGI